MDKWEYCVVYGGWQQETWVYFLRADVPAGYTERHYPQGGPSTFGLVAELGAQGWEAYTVQPKFGGAVDATHCTFSHHIWFLRRPRRSAP